jgi:putative oxidoreductase
VIGLPLAWASTLGEIVSGSLLALGWKVRYCLLFHTVIIVMGIILIHARLGWFVVGLRGGSVEYSLLILSVMALLYSRSEEA